MIKLIEKLKKMQDRHNQLSKELKLDLIEINAIIIKKRELKS